MGVTKVLFKNQRLFPFFSGTYFFLKGDRLTVLDFANGLTWLWVMTKLPR